MVQNIFSDVVDLADVVCLFVCWLVGGFFYMLNIYGKCYKIAAN